MLTRAASMIRGVMVPSREINSARPDSWCILSVLPFFWPPHRQHLTHGCLNHCGQVGLLTTEARCWHAAALPWPPCHSGTDCYLTSGVWQRAGRSPPSLVREQKDNCCMFPPAHRLNLPSARKAARSCTRSGVLNASTRTVARPSAVKPMIVPSSWSRKCSSHSCVRGLKSHVRSPVWGSMAAIFGPLCLLQSKHAHARFSHAVWPPCCSAIT